MKVPFYKRREFWGAVISAGSVVADASAIGLFPQHTVVYKVGVGLGLVLAAFGLRRGYKDENLPGQKDGLKLPEGMRKK